MGRFGLAHYQMGFCRPESQFPQLRGASSVINPKLNLFSFPIFLPPPFSSLLFSSIPKMHRVKRWMLVPSYPTTLRSLLRPPPPSSYSYSYSSDSSIIISKGPVVTQESVVYVLKQLDKKPPKALEFFNHVTSVHGFKPGPTAYNLILRILGGHPDHSSDFWLLLRSMDSSGHSLDDGTYLNLLSRFKARKMPAEVSALSRFHSQKRKGSAADATVEMVSRALLGSSEPWDEEAEKRVRGIGGFHLSGTVVAKVLREARNSPLKALAFFRWSASASSDYEHGPVAYNAMARVLGREESVTEFWELIEEMTREGVVMDIDTYVKMSRQFVRNKMVEEAVKLYEFMMDGPYKPAVQDCGILLRHISLSGNPDLDLVSRVVTKYEAAGHSLSKVVYDGIHRSLTSNAKFEEAEVIIKKMRDEGYEPDNITYSQLVYGLCKAKRFEEACMILDKMEEEGCAPDLKTWTVLIQGQCQAGEIDMALESLTKMLDKGCQADADLLDILVKGLCGGQRRVDGAYTLVTEMVDRARLRPWQATYKHLIQELLKERKLEEALKTLGSMKSHKYPPFADPFPPYISKFGTVEDAREFLKTLSVKTYPSHTAYLHVFKSFFDEGRYTEAQDLLFKCPHHIRKHSEITKLFGSLKVENAA